jgi:enediyne biosynthesis protein E4
LFKRVHFGLGAATAVEAIEIHWPSGKKQTVAVTGVDRILTVEEGKEASEKNSW